MHNGQKTTALSSMRTKLPAVILAVSGPWLGHKDSFFKEARYPLVPHDVILTWLYCTTGYIIGETTHLDTGFGETGTVRNVLPEVRCHKDKADVSYYQTGW